MGEKQPVAIPVSHDDRKYMALRMAIADGVIGESDFDISLNVSGGAIHIRFDDDKYSILTEDIVRAVYEHHIGDTD